MFDVCETLRSVWAENASTLLGIIGIGHPKTLLDLNNLHESQFVLNENTRFEVLDGYTTSLASFCLVYLSDKLLISFGSFVRCCF